MLKWSTWKFLGLQEWIRLISRKICTNFHTVNWILQLELHLIWRKNREIDCCSLICFWFDGKIRETEYCNLICIQFDEIFIEMDTMYVVIPDIHSHVSHIFGKKFVKATVLLIKEMIWRNVFSVRVNFSLYHTVQ